MGLLQHPNVRFLTSVVSAIGRSRLPNLLNNGPVILPVRVNVLCLLANLPNLKDMRIHGHVLRHLRLLNSNFRLLLITMAPPMEIVRRRANMLTRVCQFSTRNSSANRTYNGTISVSNCVHVTNPRNIRCNRTYVRTPSQKIRARICTPMRKDMFVRFKGGILIISPIGATSLPMRRSTNNVEKKCRIGMSLFRHSSWGCNTGVRDFFAAIGAVKA